MVLAATGGRSSSALQAAGARQLRLGTCVASGQIETDPGTRRLVARLCSGLTPEYGLQWSSLEPAPGHRRFGPVDAIVDFATARGMTVTGHALLWDHGKHGWGTPDWVRQRLTDRADWSLVRRRFETVLGRYRETIPLWTVVNEPIETGHRADGLRANLFLRSFGPAYIGNALETARAFAPAARLMINEYSLEYENPVDRARRKAVLALIDDIRRRNLPLDALGIQGHLDLGKGGIDARALGRFLQQVADRGVEIHVTEMDVQERDFTLSLAERDRRVADETARFLDAVLDQPAVRSVTTWGLSDRHSWLRGNPNGLPAGESATNRGLPFDEAMRPKPMARAISQALGRTLPVT